MGDLPDSRAESAPFNTNPPGPQTLSSSSSCNQVSSPVISLNLSPVSVDSELWMMAEERTQEIISTIQPLDVSDLARQEIVVFLQTLIRNQFQVEAFPFGSGPLKTYLPHGDIDLTVISRSDTEKSLMTAICNALIIQGDQDPRFQVKHVDCVQAQVKVIKCEVNGIAVDISFNKMEGLSALCFFEQVDQLVGRDHLFKRSIILIKAWCYYESRILGAHCGLFATYALEVLVLYIINHFHQRIVGPLSVLCKFLEYFGNFDWDNYCVSLDGPVLISSLPNTLVESQQNQGNNLLLSPDFLTNCKMVYSSPINAAEPINDTFATKYLNIIDPLKQNNNLGRSVAKGNSKRIRHALLGGARKFNEIFTDPYLCMIGIEECFANTLARNGMGERMDAMRPVCIFGTGRFESSNLCGDFAGCYRSLLSGQLYHGYIIPHSILRIPRPRPAARFQNTNPWNLPQRVVYPYHRNVPEALPVIYSPSFAPYHVVAPQNLQFNPFQNYPRPRGTGTYIPNPNYIGNRRRPPRPKDNGRANSSSHPQSPAQTRVPLGTTRPKNGNESSASKASKPALVGPPESLQTADLAKLNLDDCSKASAPNKEEASSSDPGRRQKDIKGKAKLT